MSYNMDEFQIAEINIARMKGVNINDPMMKEFVDIWIKSMLWQKAVKVFSSLPDLSKSLVFGDLQQNHCLVN